MRPLAVLFLSLALAACVSPSPSLPPSDAEGTDPAVAAAAITLASCRQYHTFFAAREADFQGSLPKGFRIRGGTEGVFDLGIEVTSCEARDGEPQPARQAFITLPVEAPPEWRMAEHVAVLPIEAYADEGLLGRYRSLGVPLVQRCTCTVRTLQNSPIVDELVVTQSNGTYTLRPVLNPSTGPFGAAKVASYLTERGDVKGILVGAYGASQNRGVGTIGFEYKGSGGAPPLHAGIAHSVQQLAAEYRYLPAPP